MWAAEKMANVQEARDNGTTPLDDWLEWLDSPYWEHRQRADHAAVVQDELDEFAAMME